ncbi:MAG: hypothetical protein ACRDE2_07170 [Chitinophagaceae bacterium]
METKEIIEAIRKMPIKERIMIIEQTAKTIHLDEERGEMEKAADMLHDDYYSNKELTIFTDLDLEDFYETR